MLILDALSCSGLAPTSLTLPAGTIATIPGPNRSGKSRLLAGIAGLNPQTSGEVRVGGLVRKAGGGDDLRPMLGYLFTDPRHQLFSPTVAEDVAFGPAGRGIQKQALQEKVDAALGQVGLAGRGGETLTSLHVDDLVWTAVAGVIACDPQVLLWDDAGLWFDEKGQMRMVEFLRRWVSEGERCVLLSSRDAALGQRIGGPMFRMEQGTLHLETGATA